MALTGSVATLAWGDFIAAVPANADENTGAFVSTSFDAQAPWRFKGKGENVEYSISSVTCTVGLNKTKMWARSDSKTAAMLVHEQGHFEITALLMRQVDQQLTALMPQKFKSQTEIEQAINDARVPLVNKIIEMQSTAARDGTYDVATHHGKNSAQDGWNRAFAACRASGSMTLEDALKAQGITI